MLILQLPTPFKCPLFPILTFTLNSSKVNVTDWHVKVQRISAISLAQGLLF